MYNTLNRLIEVGKEHPSQKMFAFEGSYVRWPVSATKNIFF